MILKRQRLITSPHSLAIVACALGGAFGVSVALGQGSEEDPEIKVVVEGPNKEKFKVTNLRLSGSGCPPRSTSKFSTESTPDGNVDYFQVVFDDFIVERSGSMGQDTATEKSCVFSFDIDHPRGMRFKLSYAEYDGYARITEGHSGYFKTSFYFEDDKTPESQEQRIAESLPFKEGYDSEYQFRSDFQFDGVEGKTGRSKVLWTKCKGNRDTFKYHIKTTLSLLGKGSSDRDVSILTNDLMSGLFTEKFKMRWVKCKP